MTTAVTGTSGRRSPLALIPTPGSGADRQVAGLPWLSPVPDCEPPFDDEITGPVRLRTLLAVPPPRTTPVDAPAPAPSGRPRRGVQPAVVSAREIPGWSREIDVGVTLTPSRALPPADRTGRMFAQALLEVLAGTRAVAQLREHCAPDVFAGLEDHHMVRGAPLPRMVTARVDQPSDGVAEVAAVFRTAERVRAMAFRLQGVDGRWRITHLQIG